MPELPFDLRMWVESYELMAPGCLYTDNRDGYRSRPEKAAHVIHSGRTDAVMRQGPRVYLVRSLSKPGVRYEVDLDYLTCECEDHRWPDKAKARGKRRVDVGERGVCWHIYAANLAESVHAAVQRERQMKRAAAREMVAEMWG